MTRYYFASRLGPLYNFCTSTYMTKFHLQYYNSDFTKFVKAAMFERQVILMNIVHVLYPSGTVGILDIWHFWTRPNFFMSTLYTCNARKSNFNEDKRASKVKVVELTNSEM